MLGRLILFPLATYQLLGPFPMCAAFPHSEYYDPSVISAPREILWLLTFVISLQLSLRYLETIPR